jgi:hypothetical protein
MSKTCYRATVQTCEIVPVEVDYEEDGYFYYRGSDGRRVVLKPHSKGVAIRYTKTAAYAWLIAKLETRRDKHLKQAQDLECRIRIIKSTL